MPVAQNSISDGPLDELAVGPAGVVQMTLMQDEEIKNCLARIKGWEVRDGKLYREVQFGSFKVALRFMKDIESIANRVNHHPDICVYYDKVVIESVTHDEGGISEKDFEIAREVNSLADRLKI